MSDKQQIDEVKEKAAAIAEETAKKAKEASKIAAEKLDEYYNKLPLDQETKDKAKAIAGEAGQKAKNIFTAIKSKLDEYYNKLPLDKINEKLGGKVDVKSSLFKKSFAGIVIIVFLFFLCLFCFSNSDDVGSGMSSNPKKLAAKIEDATEDLDKLKKQIADLSAKKKLQEPTIIEQIKKEMQNEPIPEKYGKDVYQNERLLIHLAKNNKKLFNDYERARSLAHEVIKPEGHTPQEYIDLVKKHKNFSLVFSRPYNPDPHAEWRLNEQHKGHYDTTFERRKQARFAELYKDVAILQEKQRKLSANIQKMINAKFAAERRVTWKSTKKMLEAKVPGMLNKRLDESFDTCQRIKLDAKPTSSSLRAGTITEWWWGTAYLYNSRTEKTKERLVEVRYDIEQKTNKIFIYCELKNERP